MFSMVVTCELTRRTLSASPKGRRWEPPALGVSVRFAVWVFEEALSGFDTEVARSDEGFDASDQGSPYLVSFDEPSVGHRLEHQIESDLVHDAKGPDVHSGGFGPS